MANKSMTAYISDELEKAVENIRPRLLVSGEYGFILRPREGDDKNHFESLMESIINDKVFQWNNASDVIDIDWEWESVVAPGEENGYDVYITWESRVQGIFG